MDEPNSLDTVAVIIREYDPNEDAAFIFTTWRNSAYYSSLIQIEKENEEYFKSLTIQIKKILKKAKVRIACLEDTPNVIIGYSVSTGTHLDWIYVKSDYRSQGIGTLLYPKDIKTVTSNLTKIGAAIASEKQLTIQGGKSNDSET